VVFDFVAHFTSRIPTEAGDIALAIGLVGALGSALTGYTDFVDTVGHERRVGMAHGLIMTIAVVLDTASMGLRWWAGSGLHPLAVGLSTAGLALVLMGAYLGGHLVFGSGTMVNHLAFTEGPSDPVQVGASTDFPEGGLHCARAGDMSVLLVRRGGRLFGIADVCTHAGGPLHEGSLDGGVVTCPWHGSRFRVDTGQALRGPATFPQPTFTVDEWDGRVWVSLGPPRVRSLKPGAFGTAEEAGAERVSDAPR
jgi:nitrite reductase/ring-hydroxylating ferredoxin subunit